MVRLPVEVVDTARLRAVVVTVRLPVVTARPPVAPTGHPWAHRLPAVAWACRVARRCLMAGPAR